MATAKSPTKIALADDHIVLRNALSSLIDNFENCKVIFQANDGKELTELISYDAPPDLSYLTSTCPTWTGMTQPFGCKRIFLM